MRLALFALVLLACSPNVSKCKDKTLFITVTLDQVAKAADQLLVDVSVDGGAPVHTDLQHQAGTGVGGVQIEFANGYPAGHSIKVDITAKAGGAVVGTGTVTQMLSGACEATSLMVASPSSQDLGPGADLSLLPQPDLALPGLDLSGLDFSGVDFSGLDAAVLDAAPSQNDLTPVCVPVAESCFNGADDDCDGKIDCADSDCTGGATPVAVCVPNPGSFTVGTTVPGACPTAWPASTTIHSGLASNCGQGTCGCTPPTLECGAEIWNRSNSPTCNGGGTGVSYVSTSVCSGPFSIPTISFHDSSAFNAGDCGSGTGAADKQTPTWSNTESFCSGGAVGGGCTGGAMCVPAATKHCVIKAGSQSCPANYMPSLNSYYLNFDDSTRTCFCACFYTQAPCSGMPTVTLYTDSGCTQNATDLGSCSNANLALFNFAKASGPLILDNSVCKSQASNIGGPTPTNQQTVCCTP